MSRAAWAGLVVVALCAFLGSWSLLHHGTLGKRQIMDTPTYESYGDAAVNGAIPYRDFDVAYPPGALPVFLLPALGHAGDVAAYRRWFDREMALCGCLALIGAALCLRALRAGAVRTTLALYFLAASPLLVGSLVLSRFDWWPTALAALALALLLYDRPAASAVLLALGVAAKLWPVVFVPLLATWLWRRRGADATRTFAIVLVGVLAVIFVPFAAIAPNGLGHSFHQQLARPLQLESLGSAVLIAVHHWAGTTLHVRSSFGSQNVTGPGAALAEALTTAAGAVALAAIWLVYARGPAVAARLVTSCAAAVASLLAFGKVFSPQFVVWLIPFVLLVPGARGLASALLLAAILALTHAWFPLHYWELARGFAPTQSGELLARDLCVVALLVVLAWPGRLQHEVLGEHRARVEALQRVRAQVD